MGFVRAARLSPVAPRHRSEPSQKGSVTGAAGADVEREVPAGRKTRARYADPMPTSPRTSRRRPNVTEAVLVGGVEKRTLLIEDYSPAWQAAYSVHHARITSAMGENAIAVEHIGSTSVPGLAAKPIIDVLVTVPDITAEEDYLEQLVSIGYQLRVREPGHRMVRTPQRDVHVHLLEANDPAAADYLLLRDQLRADAQDRDLYERVKRDLLQRDWSDMNAYAEAKTKVIEGIKARARADRRNTHQ